MTSCSVIFTNVSEENSVSIFRVCESLVAGFPPQRPGFRARVWSGGICGGQSGAGAGFLRVLRFSLPIFIPPIAPQSSSSIIWGWYNRPEVAAVPSGLSPTPLIIIIKKLNHFSALKVTYSRLHGVTSQNVNVICRSILMFSSQTL
jgi:hypothetical protein